MTKILSGKSNVDLDYPICRPSLDLDFTHEELDPRVTFTRASTATRVNRNRVIETVGVNVPRFDYDPVTGECRGLLIEESRSNLLLYSQDLGTGWSNPAGTTELVNVTTSPDGTSTADKLVEDTSSGQHYVSSSSVSWASSTTYTFSVFAKAETRYFLDLAFGTSSFWVNGHRRAVFNLARGTVHSTAGASLTALITPYPNGWYRCSITATTVSTAVAATTCQLLITSDGTSGGSYPGDGTSGLYLWGAQTEQGAFPTSYIPTTASTVTRSADNASMTGTNFSSWYNQSEGTLYASINNITTRSSITYDAFVSLAGTDVNRNVIRIYTQTASGGGGQNYFLGAVAYSPDGSYVVDSFDSYVGGAQRIGKAILAYKKDNFAFTVNGLKPTRDVSGGIPTCNQLLIFGASRFQLAPSGYISRLTYYPRALKPNQLQYLTQ